MTSASKFETTNVSSATSGSLTIGWPLRLKDVFRRTGNPVSSSNCLSNAQNRGFSSLSTVWSRADPSTWVTAPSWSRYLGRVCATNSMCGEYRSFPSAISKYSLADRSEEHTSELQSQSNLVCRLLLEKKHVPVVLRVIGR